MQLDGKVAIVYGAAGSMGGAVARAFAAEGARLFLAGRTLATVQALADEVRANGGRAQAAEVDVDDRDSVEWHGDEVLDAAGRIDVSFNAAGMDAVQESALVDMSLDDFMTPITEAARRHFITMTAAARRMAPQGAGAIVTLTSSAAKEWRHRMGGFSLGCASIEVLTRTLAGELKGSGVRVACIRANFTPETARGIPDGATDPLLADTLLPRLPRLDEVAAAAVYLASDRAGATTGAVLDLTCGAIVS
ncbi:MAG: SDR family oxidoreductase [Acidimicrobiia bacterium]|nr:SDR family oxidoreductase [Acidimicrobiia bacterium]